MLLLVQHAATIARNALGLTPRDYALDPETHDTLKVQELKQGFELRYDLVLSVSHKGSGGSLVLGPPPPEDVTLAALKAAKKSLEQAHTKQADAAVFIQWAIRKRGARRGASKEDAVLAGLMPMFKDRTEAVAAQGSAKNFNRRPSQLMRMKTEAKLLGKVSGDEENVANSTAKSLRYLVCVKALAPLRTLGKRARAAVRAAALLLARCCSQGASEMLRQVRTAPLLLPLWVMCPHPTPHLTVASPPVRQRRELIDHERRTTVRRMATEQRQLLMALRLARVDYVLIRPFGDDRVYICLTAALATLRAHAEDIGMVARLRDFPTELERQVQSCHDSRLYRTTPRQASD